MPIESNIGKASFEPSEKDYTGGIYCPDATSRWLVTATHHGIVISDVSPRELEALLATKCDRCGSPVKFMTAIDNVWEFHCNCFCPMITAKTVRGDGRVFAWPDKYEDLTENE